MLSRQIERILGENTKCAQHVSWLYCERFVTFSSVLRAFCSVLRHNFTKNAFCDCFAVFCGVLQMFCEKCFVQYSRIFGLLENSRNTQAYCEYFVFSSVFRCISGVLWKYCKTLAKHRKTPAKHHNKTPAKHHKTPQKKHLLTKQPEFANKPALALKVVAPPRWRYV